MAKSLSVHRRKANLVDLFLVSRPGVVSYLFKAASNFDVGPSAIQMVPQSGFCSVSARPFADGFSESQFRGRTRFMFAPSDYGLNDALPMWLCVSPVNADGTTGPDEALHLILPPYTAGRQAVVLAGAAPAGADASAALELQMQFQMQGLEIQNNGSGDLYISFERGGPEFLVSPLQTGFTNPSFVHATFSQLFVRGAGGSVQFSAMTSARNERL